MASQLILDTPLAPPLPIRRFTVEQYHQLGELGVLSPEDSVELLEGWIVEKMNQRPIHGFIVRLLNELLLRDLPNGWVCQCQLPITTERSEPEPDLAILKGSHVDFRSQHPSGSDCRLIIEVADTSLEKDRAKSAIYCNAGVQEYWIVNVTDKCLEQYRFFDGSQRENSRLSSFSREAQEPEILRAETSVVLDLGGTHVEISLRQLFK